MGREAPSGNPAHFLAETIAYPTTFRGFTADIIQNKFGVYYV